MRTSAPHSSILVVDDHPANILAIKATVAELGTEVVCANSGLEALRLLLDRDFAMILLDVRMPGMDGFEAARLIRARKRSAHTPIIFITASDTDDSEALRAYQLGAVDFLSKPIVEDILRAKVSVFLALHARSTEIAQQSRAIHLHERNERTRLLAQQREQWAAESLKRQMAYLEDIDQHKDRFIALLGHELRNPLTAMTTALELLRPLADTRVTYEMRHTRDVLERQAQHFTSLVDDLLDVSRISAGKIALRKAPIRMQEILQHAVAMSQSTIDAHQHTLQIVQPAEPLWIKADGVRLVQVVSNLLTNAARYTEPRGKIIAECSADGEWVALRVSDNGRGIHPDFLQHIFEPFTQERRNTGSSGGLGLGLSLVRNLVTLHGGTVTAQSAGTGHGSEFTVRLPRLEVDFDIDSSHEPTCGGTAKTVERSMQILLIDDNEDNGELLSMLLTSWGHRVLLASDGEHGCKLALHSEPDVVFVDIGLPDIDGYAVARRLRANRPGADMRLVALTGYGHETDRARALAAGFDLHIVKPASIEALRSALAPEPKKPSATVHVDREGELEAEGSGPELQ